MPTIAEMPIHDRPRERLLREGGAALSEAELLAVLLRTGTAGTSAVELAGRLLADSGGLAGLATLDGGVLRREGIGPAKAAAVLAAVEVGRRLVRADLPERIPLSRPDAVARYLALRHGEPDQEIMGALYLDVRHRLLEERSIFRGTLSRAAVEPRAILKPALQVSAAGILLFHTHPSGDPSPSAEDLAFTRRMGEACELIGVRLLDHLVLGGAHRWISLRRRGGW